MISVHEATKIILGTARDFGSELVRFELANGRVLTEPLIADRDLPPFDRVTMDGIALRFADFEEKSDRFFEIEATQSAGQPPLFLGKNGACIEIMTGAVLPAGADTIVRFEDLKIENGRAKILAETLKKGQNIHRQGEDRRAGEQVCQAGRLINPTIVQMAVSIGKTNLLVRKLPKIAVISTGDELVEPDQPPLPHQIRRSNVFAISAILQQKGQPAGLFHLPDNQPIILKKLADLLARFDVLLLSGGVSMGKFDYLPMALEQLGVRPFFHKVAQRPGKPFWFGQAKNGPTVFAFPGNPVSTFLCLHRYFLPWLDASFGLKMIQKRAVLTENISFSPALQLFQNVKIGQNETCQLTASPVSGNGSGDFSALVEADGFLELPADRSIFEQGETFPVWPF